MLGKKKTRTYRDYLCTSNMLICIEQSDISGTPPNKPSTDDFSILWWSVSDRLFQMQVLVTKLQTWTDLPDCIAIDALRTSTKFLLAARHFIFLCKAITALCLWSKPEDTRLVFSLRITITWYNNVLVRSYNLLFISKKNFIN